MREQLYLIRDVLSECTVQVWQWLGFNRFFPARGDKPLPKVMRGCASVSLSLYRCDQ